MNVLLIGSRGQLARELINTCPDEGIVLKTMASPDIDITDQASIDRAFDDNLPGLVINAAAFTNVDGAEKIRKVHIMLITRE